MLLEAMWGLRVAGNAGYGEEIVQELPDWHWTNHGFRKLSPNGHQYGVTKVGICGEEPLDVALQFDGSTWSDRVGGCWRPIVKTTGWVVVGMTLRARAVHVIVKDWTRMTGKVVQSVWVVAQIRICSRGRAQW